MSRWNLAWLLGVPAVLIAGLAVVYSSPTRQKERDYELVRTVVEVLAEVDENYVHQLSPEAKKKLVEDMINGGLERLDPYSSYLNEADTESLERHTHGNYGGVGINLGQDRTTGLPRVISPMVGTPAYDAGILAGDLILKVDGKSTENLRLDDLIPLILGEPGTKVTLTVLHEGTKEPVEVTITRAEIKVPSVLGDTRRADDPKEWEYFVDPANKIAYVRLTGFTETTARELKQALDGLQQQGVKGLVLDLRDNPGGLLREGAVAVSDLFLPEGLVVRTVARREQDGKEYYARTQGTEFESAAKVPMAVLINHNSASASEIVAAALQDHNRAVVVGQRSYGKGSVQNLIDLPKGDPHPKTQLKLTTATYWRPSGHNIHRGPDAKETDEWGVKPSPGYEVPMKADELYQFRLWRRARDQVPGRPGTAGLPQGAVAPKEFTDRVLQKALEYLRGEVKKSG